MERRNITVHKDEFDRFKRFRDECGFTSNEMVRIMNNVYIVARPFVKIVCNFKRIILK